MDRTTSVAARSALRVAALASLLGLPCLAWAQAPEQTLFGPKQYDHPNSGTSRTVDTVRVSASFTGPFTLRIRNGDDRDGVHDASVFLNGARILGDEDFGSKTTELERTVQLQADNELVVAIRGRPRTHLTLSISGRRAPAKLTGLAPDPLTLVTGTPGVLTATLSPPPAGAGTLSLASENASIAAVPASVAFVAEQTQVQIPVASGSIGGAKVTASLNGASVTATVKVVPPPPHIDAIAPASAAAGTLVTLSGAFFDPAPASNQVSFPAAGGASVPAAVVAANASQITVKVPPLAASGPITLTNSGGTAQSAAFTLLPLNARFTATRTGLTARTAVSGSPVTPFVQGAEAADALSFLVLAPPANGTGSVIGNKLTYLSNPGFNGPDSFPYRAIAADGSTLDGTALVRVYNGGGQLSRCITPSTQTTTTVGGVTTTTVTRINSMNCSFYGEVATRASAAGVPVTVQYIALRPSNGAAPKAVVYLIGGGDFDLNFAGNAATGVPTQIGGNFVVRTAQLFADAGYLAIAMNKPSDQPPPGSTNTIIDADQYRISVNHAVDILTVLREVNTNDLDVFLAGTSRGAISAVATNLIAAGISLSSAVTRASTGPGPLFVNDPRHPNLQPAFVQRPVHVLWNTNDLCPLSRPADSQTLFDNLNATGVPAAFNFVSGGFINDTDVCGAQHFHGYMGIEKLAVDPVTSWLDGRVTALAGNKRPDASFAEVPVASGAPIAIDLATLARDPDGDALSYTLSHSSTSLGGTVTLDGATATYTPPAGAANATDRFVYVVTDGRGGVSAAVITLRIGG